MKIGIIGLGEVSQLMHLPIVQDLTDRYSLEAVADVSPALVASIAKKYGVRQTYTDPAKLIAEADIEAVFILSPDQYHGEYIKLALARGLHIFVEKPAALCRRELMELMELEKQHPDQIVMVGYMRRYAAPYLKAKELLATDSRKVQYLRFTDIILESAFFIGQTRPIFSATDVPADVIAEGRARRAAQVEEAVGADSTPAQRVTYQMMTGLGCHSFSAVRELLGTPKKIKSVNTACGGEQVVVVMEFDGYMATYELVNNQTIQQFDACIEIYQGDRKMKLKYETPYIRYLPSTLEVTETTNKESVTTVYGPYHNDAFQTELVEFSECVKTKRRPKTVLADSLNDLELFEEIIRVMGKEEN